MATIIRIGALVGAFVLGAVAGIMVGWTAVWAAMVQEDGPRNGYEMEARLRGDL